MNENDENVVFNPSPDAQQPVVPQEAMPPVPKEPQVVNLDSLPPSEPPPPIRSSPFSLGLFLKLGVGLVVLVLLFLLVTRVILPFFSGKEKAKTVTITYWGLWEDPGVMRTIIGDFERQNPNIKVTYSLQDIKQYKDRLLTRIPIGNGPDIFRYHNTWIPVLQKQNVMLPLSQDVITPQEFKKAYYPVIQNDLIRNGAIYGIPLGIDTLSLFVNTQIFEEGGYAVPTTWDDFDKVARLLTVREGGVIKTSGAAMGVYKNVNHASDIVALLMIQNGTNMKNIAATEQNASEALEFYTSFSGNTWDASMDKALDVFARGNLAMYFGYSWDVFPIKTQNKALQFKVYPVPLIGDTKLTIASYWVDGISAKSLHQKEAKVFLKFLAQKQTQQKFFTEASKTRDFGEPYARVDLGQTLKNNQLVYPFIEQAPYAVSTYFSSDTYDESSTNPGINTRMNQYLQNAINSVGDNTSAQSATDTLAKGVSQVLQLYGQK